MGEAEGLVEGATDGDGLGLVEGEAEGEGLGLGSGVGLGEGELTSPNTSCLSGRKTDLIQNPEPTRITSNIPDNVRVNLDGF